MLPPLPRCSSWAYSSLISPGRISLPRKGCRVGLHIVLFEACSAFTRVAACTLARSPIRDPLPEGFRHFVTSMPAPVASGWSESPGGACTHWKAPPCHGAHPFRTFGAGIKSRTLPPLDFPERWSLCLAAWTQRNPAGGQRSPADPIPFYLICHCCVSDSLQLAKYSTLSASGDANVLSRH